MFQASLISGLAAALAVVLIYLAKYARQPELALKAEAVAREVAHKRQSGRSKQQQSTRALLRHMLLVASAVLFAAVAVGIFVLFPAPAERGKPAMPPAVPVNIAVAREVEWPNIMSLPGTVGAVDTATLASRAGGWVTKVLVEAGARVAKGDLLAEVGAVDLHSQLVQAQARLATAQASYKQASAQETRYRTLLRQQSVAAEQYQAIERNFFAAKAELDAATAALATAETDLDYAEIRAPFSGIVAAKNIWLGDYASPGATLFVIAGHTPEIRAQAAPATYASLKVGAKAVVVVDSKKLPAVVTALVDAADPQTHTHLIKLRLEGAAVAPYGAYAEVKLNLGKFRAITVPETALTVRAGLLNVFAVGKDHRVHLRLVRTGQRESGQVTIMAGLKAGDMVIVTPPPDLDNGALVVPTPTPGTPTIEAPGAVNG
jgi:RND family efflux transporter MFP subunit